MEREVKELSLQVYDPNRRRLHPRELYALIHVIFCDTNIQVYLHKKYYLSIGSEWIEDRSKPEVEFDDEQQQSFEQELTNLRVLEWLNEMTSDRKETSVTIQDLDRKSMKYRKTEREDPSWAAQVGRLLIPASNLDLISGMRSTWTSMDIFVRGVGVGLIITENLLIEKLRIARETGELEAETGEDPKKPDIGRVVKSYFNLPNEYSSSIILTDSDFILTNRTCAIAITADMSFKTALAADFKREYENIE